MNTSYSYDSVSHLLSVLHQAGTNVLDGASYTYDAAGNRSSKTNYLNGTSSNYTYDPLYQLTQVTQGGSTTESYSYDAVGNRLSSAGLPNYSYNASNELMSSSAGSYTYDNNGNTLTDAQGRSFTWDFENRLTQAVVPGANGGTTTFKYDPSGLAPTRWHRDTTYNLALQIFGSKCAGQARAVADANAATDDPGNIVGWYRFLTFEGEGWDEPGPHFPNPSTVGAGLGQAIKTCSVDGLGRSLHSLQDLYFHWGITPKWHYVMPYWDYLVTGANHLKPVPRVNAAVSGTAEILQLFKEKCLQCCK